MVGVRKTIAILALSALGGLIITSNPLGPVGPDRQLVSAVRWLLLPLGVTIAGLVLDRPWGRWVAIATGIAVLPWSVALTFGETYGASTTRPTIALVASLLLLVSLPGRAMFERFEGRIKDLDWRGRRMSLLRWTIICNIAAALALYPFVTAYEARIAWHIAIPAVLLAGLVLGVLLLAYQKTAGLLWVALCCLLFVPAGAYFVSQEASHAGEAVLFASLFAPGVLTAWASLIAFGRPILSALRER
jgi:hypothetical protein